MRPLVVAPGLVLAGGVLLGGGSALLVQPGPRLPVLARGARLVAAGLLTRTAIR